MLPAHNGMHVIRFRPSKFTYRISHVTVEQDSELWVEDLDPDQHGRLIRLIHSLPGHGDKVCG